ncbi:MAG: adenylate cyclase class 1 [Oleispira sp.]|jgi:adenylate cyclase class 1
MSKPSIEVSSLQTHKTHMKLPPPHQINQWQQSFLSLNSARLEQARSLMLERQIRVLDVLPILLHVNHPQLSGFINQNVPAGIEHYTPQVDSLKALRHVAKGLKVPRVSGVRSIQALFLMGSLGTLAQASDSDLDVWLCHAPDISDEQIALLKAKCNLIEKWATSQKVEIHFFLMNAEEFRQGKQQAHVDAEHSGSTQHLLLLDEFYRSSLWLAGRMPSWWLVPTQYEKHSQRYLEQLSHQALMHDVHWINFGSISTIPAAEFVGAGLWQLNKGLHNPYKSLLKLLLTQHYASQYPKIRPLCWDLKDTVHRGNIDSLSCDGYLLMLNRVSKHVAGEHNDKRLELLRRAFYFKANLPLTSASQGQQRQWRYQELQQIVTQWHWTRAHICHLDHRQEWQVYEVQAERNALVNEMLISYRYLAAFSDQYTKNIQINRQDLTVLGNQLYAFYDAKPGKILTINPNIAANLVQDKISLILSNEKRWQLVSGAYHKETDHRIIKQSSSLIELLCYAHFNGLLSNYTNYAIYPEHNPLTQYELTELLQVVRSIPLPNHMSAANFLRPSIPIQWQLFINVGIDPMHHLTRRGMQKLSSRNDALGYSALKENLIQSIDLLTINSWGEWRIQRFQGQSALIESLRYLLQHIPLARKQGWPEHLCHCFCATRADAISLRVKQVLEDLTQHTLEQPKVDYILETGKYYYVWQQDKKGIKLQQADSVVKFLAILALPRQHYGHYKLDTNALSGSPLKAIFNNAKPGAWQLYFWRKEDSYFWYLLDEHGVLLHQQQKASSDSEVLLPIIRFLRQVDKRLQGRLVRKRARKLLLFELQRNNETTEFEPIPRRLPPLQEQASQIQLNAILDDQEQVNIYCNGEEFSIWEWGDQLYQKVAQTLLNMRADNETYPVYLTDLALYGDESIIQHIKFKQGIEKDLNHALMTLSTTR